MLNRTRRMVGLVIFSLAGVALSVTLPLPASQFSHRSHQIVDSSSQGSPASRPAGQVGLASSPTPPPVPVVQSVDSVRPADRIPSALDVAMNPFRYVGARVRWTCLVDRVPAPTFANARCGLSATDFGAWPLSSEELLHRAVSELPRRAMVVLTGAVADLEYDERIVFEGTVRHPSFGENAYGAERYYPTIHIDRFLARQPTDD